MEIKVEFLDEQIAALNQEVDKCMQNLFSTQGALRLAEHFKARLSAPEPVGPEPSDPTPPDET